MADDHDAFLDLAAPYALGVLAGAERDAFVAHLATCAACRQEVASLARLVEALPQTVDQAPLPPELRARVLAAATAPDIRTESAPRQRPRNWTGWLAAAATLAAIVFGALAWISRTENARLREQLSAAREREAALDRQVAALQSSAAYAARTAAVSAAA